MRVMAMDRVRVGANVRTWGTARAEGRVRVRVRGGRDYFLRLHTSFSIVGVIIMSQPHSLG